MTTVMGLRVCLLAAMLAFKEAQAVECPGAIMSNTCFQKVNTSFIGEPIKAADPAGCCGLCAKTPLCSHYMWAYPNSSGWFTPSMCYLVSGSAHIKKPVHPSQSECVVSAPPPPPPLPPLPPAPPGAVSVLYVLVDDLRTQLEPYGHEYMHTPNLAKFADEAVVFTQAHCNSQMCVPTRNSFMSGRRPDVTRVFNDGIGNANFRVAGPNWTTFPEHFKNHGYFTTGVGKTFHPSSPPNFDQPTSWSNTTEYPYYYPSPTKCDVPTDVWCRIDNATAEFEDLEILAEGQRRLRAAAADPTGRPFFVAVGFHKPHTPYRAPGKWFDLYPPPNEIATAVEQEFPMDQNLTGLAWFSCKAEGAQYPINHSVPYPTDVQQLLRRAYYASVSFFDSNIGELLSTVDELGLTDKIITIFHADHGYQLGERNIYCKETCFNLATHVPLMIRAPMYHGNSGSRVSAMVELVSVFPTAVELAGVPPLDPTVKGEPALGGRSFAGLVKSPGAGPVASSFNISFSQYARARCLSDLFADQCEVKSDMGHFIGYSMRSPGLRYTRWVNVSIAGDPFWNQVIGEELYKENVTSDDFDLSERMNIMYTPEANATDIQRLRAELAAHHGQSHP